MAICEICERAHDVPLKFEVAHYVPEADGWRPSSVLHLSSPDNDFLNNASTQSATDAQAYLAPGFHSKTS